MLNRTCKHFNKDIMENNKDWKIKIRTNLTKEEKEMAPTFVPKMEKLAYENMVIQREDVRPLANPNRINHRGFYFLHEWFEVIDEGVKREG